MGLEGLCSAERIRILWIGSFPGFWHWFATMTLHQLCIPALIRIAAITAAVAAQHTKADLCGSWSTTPAEGANLVWGAGISATIFGVWVTVPVRAHNWEEANTDCLIWTGPNITTSHSAIAARAVGVTDAVSLTGAVCAETTTVANLVATSDSKDRKTSEKKGAEEHLSRHTSAPMRQLHLLDPRVAKPVALNQRSIFTILIKDLIECAQ